MKRFLTIVLSMGVLLSVLAACGRGNTVLTVYFLGASVLEDDAVVEAANARLSELGLDFEIRPIWGGWGAGEPIQLALDTGDTGIDVVFTSSWAVNFWSNARRGNFIRLDDPDDNLLARYGQGVLATVPQMLWNAFTVDGARGVGVYGVPGYKDFAQMYAWDVNNTRLEELGFSFYDFNWSYDTFFNPLFEAALVAAKERYGPTFFPLVVEPELFVRALSNSDLDPTGLGLFHFGFDPANPSLPINPAVGLNFENDRYMRVLERLHDFFERGFIDPRVAIAAEAPSAVVELRNSGQYLFSIIVYAYGHTAAASTARGIDSRFPPVSRPIVSSISAVGSGYAISVYSQNRAEAMQFLNAWYTDTQLATILAYGVEGTHFTRNANGTVTRNTDMMAQFSPWRFGMGNIFVLPPTDIDGPDYFASFRAYNQAGVATTFLGFAFDEDPVITEIAALRNVQAEFHTVVTTGAVNPAVTVPQYLQRLNDNGLERVREELNRQLQAFYASR